jgi:hypothetical protein
MQATSQEPDSRTVVFYMLASLLSFENKNEETIALQDTSNKNCVLMLMLMIIINVYVLRSTTVARAPHCVTAALS